MKMCKKCLKEKDLSCFYKDRNGFNGYRSICKDCDILKAKTWNKNNSKEHCSHQRKWRTNNRQASRDQRNKYVTNNKLSVKKSSLKFNYGLTLEAYQELLERQNHCCAVCNKNVNELTKSLCVDHCHSTNKIRGLLCRNCNSGIGLLGDTVDGLQKAIQYLLQFKESP